MSVESTLPFENCWPVDWSVCDLDCEQQLSDAQRAVSEGLAVQTLRMLTGYRAGGCPVTVRPCSPRCKTSSWLVAPVGPANWAGAYGGWGFNPYVGPGGAWLNACGCKRDDCSCTKVHELILPGHVGMIVQVVQDGVTLDPSIYRVDDGNRLVRMDGEDWPSCQDMNADSGEGTLLVTYLNGNPVDAVGSHVAGLLAGEYAKACLGAACALPANATNVARQGITVQLDPEMFSNGTGIKLVDDYIRIWNPFSTMPAQVFSPDDRPARQTTWRV